ncbi:helix-turn-helix domain-containing protein [Paenibacillus sp. FSL K6-1122]|uniref:Helix-turn-helix domain-containing protein n=1 Tax=Paenibacillus amylolyticus TaxID=1451 RepID=A0ABD8ATG0_PAEAM|nr:MULTISPECIES: helix-turn-helix domain-containing protein [Paenibacillus]ETT43022.1 AraC family transcriptional regulator [Paenibacillus sp. FSL H7-689]OME92551.1 AraC family transcriptional regulator [Paenibacillus amylolyticus]PKQ88181.1 AraC family transcriptional regulator [Paenibacillus sp. BGI2013]
MSRNWYYRLLFSYFPIFFLTVTILIFIAFVFINDISKEETKKADRISSSYMIDTVDRTIRDIELSILETVQSQQAYKLYFNNTNLTSSDTVYAIAQNLRELSNSSSWIQSIYLYDKRNKHVLTVSGSREVEGFSDKAWIDQMGTGSIGSGWQPVREFDADSVQRTPIRVLTVNKDMPLPFGSQGTLVINIKMSSIEQSVDSMVNGQLSFLTITDRDGKVVYNAHSDQEGSIDGQELNRLALERLGWTISSGIKAGNLFGWVSVISYVWVIIAIVTVICAIVYIVYITRRNYKPIQIIMNRIESHQIRAFEHSGARTDEMKMIDGVLENLINHMMDYDKKSRENVLMQRSKLFNALLHGEHMENAAEQLKELSPLNDVHDSSRFVVVVGEINRYEKGFQERYTRGEQNTLKFALMNVLQELSRNTGVQCWTEWISVDRIAILFVFKEQNDNNLDMSGQIRVVAEECKSWVEQNLRISLSFGIGPIAQGIGTIRDSYAAAEAVMQRKLLMTGDVGQADCGETQHPLLDTYTYLQMIADFVKRFRMSSGQWREQLEEIFTAFEQNKLPDDEIRSLIQAMLQMLSREVAMMSEGLQEELSEENINRWLSAVEEAETLADVKSLLFDGLTDLFRTYVAVTETKSYKAMVNEMKNYIEEQFANPDLSLKHLSDRFQITGKHASYLFKTEFNMKFVDFVTELRMKETEQLLLNTDYSLQDIALKVGYANGITLGRVFKRVTGITPGDYRRLKREHREPEE